CHHLHQPPRRTKNSQKICLCPRNHLEKEGKIKRVRGGAILKKVARKEIAIKEKNSNKDSKKKIAKLAAQFISDGDYIYLDAGTTTYEIIDYIKGKDIKVVTNGIIHLEKLIANDIETYLIGGRIKKSTLAIVGVKALRDLSEFRFDKAFIGINGINENGYSTHDIEEALIKKQAIDNSNKAFILADSSKFDIVYFANVAKLEEATIITDKKEVNKNIIKHTNIISTY
ncbi:MAG: DeoR/GlpR family DNA-binding transcription regulator, partial [Fusobacterium polymorphum]